MKSRERAHGEHATSAMSKWKMKQHRRTKRRERNKLRDVATIEAVSLPISAVNETPATQHGDPISGQVRVSYDKDLPFLPQADEVAPELAGIANGMHPILQTNELVQPIPYGTPLRTQNHGGKGGPQEGNFTRMRPVAYGASQDPAFYAASIGGENFGVANGPWGSASQFPPANPGPPPDPYKGMVIQGSSFPYKPVKTNKKIKANKHVKEKIVPVLDRWLAAGEITRGMHALIMVHAIKEGFYPGTRAYRYNNPGNVGNTDSGANKGFDTVEDGLTHLKNYINRVATGQQSAYKFGPKSIKPYYSKEIERNRDKYGMSPHLPGYEFEYTGQIDQYVKIYATGARQGNSYLSMIISYFNMTDSPSALAGRTEGQAIGSLSETSKIQDIILLT